MRRTIYANASTQFAEEGILPIKGTSEFVCRRYWHIGRTDSWCNETRNLWETLAIRKREQEARRRPLTLSTSMGLRYLAFVLNVAHYRPRKKFQRYAENQFWLHLMVCSKQPLHFRRTSIVIIAYGIHVIWENLTAENSKQLNRLKPFFVKRARGLCITICNRPTYFVADTPPYSIKLRRSFELLATEDF